MKPEKQILVDLADADIPYSHEPSSRRYFGEVQRRYPVIGSKIAWSQVVGAVVESAAINDGDAYLAAAESFVDRSRAIHRLSDKEEVVVVGDSAMDGALRMSLESLRRCLGVVLGMPQHTYVLAQNADWCFVFTMEGDLCFGFAPPKIDS